MGKIKHTLVAATAIAGAVALAPTANATTVHMWSYDVSWGGSSALPILERVNDTYYPRAARDGWTTGVGTATPGAIIGVDPVIAGPISWASCTLYVDGVAVVSDYATKGDGHDVACLYRVPVDWVVA